VFFVHGVATLPGSSVVPSAVEPCDGPVNVIESCGPVNVTEPCGPDSVTEPCGPGNVIIPDLALRPQRWQWSELTTCHSPLHPDEPGFHPALAFLRVK